MKKAVMYGAGNIGRGFIGQLFAQSGYEVTFIDVNQRVLDRLNQDHAYPISVVSESGVEEVIVSGVKGVDGNDTQAAIKAIAEADIMATAVGVNVLPYIVENLAAGIRSRLQDSHSAPLNIIICENLIDADKYLIQLLKPLLSPEEQVLLTEKIGFVEASVGRMVPVMTAEGEGGNPLRVYVEPYCELPVDAAAFRGDIPKINNLVPATPFAYYIQRKLFLHNMGHALLAYLSQLKGYRYIWEGAEDKDLGIIVKSAMYASAEALALEHNMDLAITLGYADDLLLRFRNRRLGDTVERVGRDIGRKLSPNDRLVGAFNLCLKHKINPEAIALGIWAALKLAPELEPGLLQDRSASGFRQSVESLLKEIK